MFLDPPLRAPPHQLRGMHEQIGLAGEDMPERAGGDPGLRRDGADGDPADALGVDHPPGRLGDLLPATVVINELGHPPW